VLQDPRSWQSGPGFSRDGCRVPMPWSGDSPPYGFSPPGSAAPWLPQPPDWAALTVAAQTEDATSMLVLHRTALGLRRKTAALGDGALRWLDAPEDVLHFVRDPGFACLVNLSARPVPLPDDAALLLASGRLTDDGLVPPDTAVWLSS
jgi:alpha-glucosidase